MAAKRSDCILVIDEDEHLSGIFTTKDIAYRVVADNFDARSATVADIMTRSPMCVTSDTSAQDALNLMVSRGFRHLPVCNEGGDIFGLLDITKCLYEALGKMERAFGSSQKLYDAIQGVEREWVNGPTQLAKYMETLRSKMACPDLTTVIDHAIPVQVPVKAQVREVAKLMKEYHTTAVLVMDHGEIAGIFTSKDIVLRVIAAGLIPDTCSVVRVMTPHPDTALPSTSILDGLKKMHDGHYLNLPVVDKEKRIIGMVDVLRLTYATLEQINSIEGNSGDGSKFWNSITMSDPADAESVLSDSLSQAANSNMFQPDSGVPTPVSVNIGYSEITPVDTVFVAEDTGFDTNSIDGTFSFKFTYGSRTHRFRCNPTQFSVFKKIIRDKIAAEHLSLSQSYVSIDKYDYEEDCLGVSYLDDDGDQVLMTNDTDLIDAVEMTQKMNRESVRLFINHPLLECSVAESVSKLEVSTYPPASIATHSETYSELNIVTSPTALSESTQIPKLKSKLKSRRMTKEYRSNYSTDSEGFSAEDTTLMGNHDPTKDIFLPAAITSLGVVILSVFTVVKLTGSNNRS
ncbi:hypothetical protein BDF14DRAFT_1718763 [Spinellus fusiger]|nr:hypothetical protein BDF14DRAFT_1718763 [Spinellus fusiger]